MKRLPIAGAALLCLVVLAGSTQGQTFPTDDPVIKSIWKQAMDSSQVEQLAHELFDVIGPRLVGTPQMNRAGDWAVRNYAAWGIDAKKEVYGKWRGWERGVSHIDLLEPRVRTLEGMMVAWSPSTKKEGVTGGVVALPALADSLAFQRWLPNARGKFVLLSQPQPTGRPDKNWDEFGTKTSHDSLTALQNRIHEEWEKRIKATGYRADTLANILENAGAAGIFLNTWSGGWGSYRVFGTKARRAPVLELSLEDYNLLYRLAENGDKPVVRVVAQSRFLDPQPAFNVIGVMRGSEKPDQYVILSAHFDSWDGASGATDNGTGTLIMMESMRILKKCYPNPKRTILVGHWGSEEEGLNGSRAFVKDHPEIVNNLQALFNQDNGTGRIVSVSAQGFLDAGSFLARWFSRIPTEVTQEVKFTFPGMPAGGGTDNASFVAAGVPAFGLGSNRWDYFSYTWHTNRDTYDKLVFDDLKNNVVLTACLAYLAADDSLMVPRDERVMPVDEKTGKPRPWPKEVDPERAGGLEK